MKLNKLKKIIKESIQELQEQQNPVLATVQSLSSPQNSQRFTCPNGYRFGSQGNTNPTNVVFGGQSGPNGVVSIYAPVCVPITSTVSGEIGVDKKRGIEDTNPMDDFKI
jgi:hypothetical protein